VKLGGGLPPFIGSVAGDEGGRLRRISGDLGLRLGLHWPLARVAAKHFQRKRHWWVGHGTPLGAPLRAKFAPFGAGKRGVPKNIFSGQKARTAGAVFGAPPALGDAAAHIRRYAPRLLNGRVSVARSPLDRDINHSGELLERISGLLRGSRLTRYRIGSACIKSLPALRAGIRRASA
jgi:hypothetical protein